MSDSRAKQHNRFLSHAQKIKNKKEKKKKRKKKNPLLIRMPLKQEIESIKIKPINKWI